jgi:hypothetical protein
MRILQVSVALFLISGVVWRISITGQAFSAAR